MNGLKIMASLMRARFESSDSNWSHTPWANDSWQDNYENRNS